MIRHVQGNLLYGHVDIIAHQVNCYGCMGSGVALQVRRIFPEVYQLYQRYASPDRLGTIQVVYGQKAHGREVAIVNMFAQLSFGYDGKRYTDYNALRNCLRELCVLAQEREASGLSARIGLPYYIGCCRGGGDWDIVYQIIWEELRSCDVTLFELPSHSTIPAQSVHT